MESDGASFDAYEGSGSNEGVTSSYDDTDKSDDVTYSYDRSEGTDFTYDRTEGTDSENGDLEAAIKLGEDNVDDDDNDLGKTGLENRADDENELRRSDSPVAAESGRNDNEIPESSASANAEENERKPDKVNDGMLFYNYTG